MEDSKKNTENIESEEMPENDISSEKSSAGESESSSSDSAKKDSANKEAQKENEIDWQDKFVRLHADWDNYRKRVDEQRADERARATERLMSDLLVCVDDMTRTIDYATEHGEGDLLSGVVAVNNKFRDVLEKHGLVEIDPTGEPFDPIIAQAVGTVEDVEVFDETVRDVYQKGYRLGIKVLRPAMVTITTGGKKRPAEASADNDNEKCEDCSETEDTKKAVEDGSEASCDERQL